METKHCRVCKKELTNENWYPSFRKKGDYICKYCHREQARLRYKENPDKERARVAIWRKANPEKARACVTRWRKENPEKNKACVTRSHRKNGQLPMSENKDSAAYLGVYINERLIRFHFKDVKVMPYGHSGFDFICNKNMKIDAKSACLTADGRWMFAIKHNTEADYFLCVAYDDREHLNIVHVWMIPGEVVNHLKGASISPSTIHKWDKYIYDIEGFSACCNAMKNGDKQ